AMAKIEKQTMFVINVQEEEAKCTESQLDILLKIHCGQYRLVKKKKRSTVWNVYREIMRPDGSKLKWRYYCLGCKRVMQSTGGTTSNLRIHKCHVRFLKQHGKESEASPQSPQRSRLSTPGPSSTKSLSKKPMRSYKELYEEQTVQSSEAEDDYYEEEADFTTITNTEVSATEDHDMLSRSTFPLMQDSSAELSLNSSERPLLKLFSEEDSTSWSPEITEVQPIVELEADQSQDFRKETIKPNPALSMQIDASALSEAESYARAWAHAFLKLSEDQKFYAKRSIDELLVLGRLERLNISTVTSLTTNL
ncbi:hypothetical protein KR222_010454, partial [Zaprionus bogoriensis]